jgi:hypothetical protein
MMDPSEMDVVVWTESEERQAWWREVLGICADARSCMAGEMGELPLSGAQPARESSLRACAPIRRRVDAA